MATKTSKSRSSNQRNTEESMPGMRAAQKAAKTTIGAARRNIEAVGSSLGKTIGSPNAIPLALGGFVVGVLAGVFGALYFPTLRDSELVRNVGDKVGQAKDVVVETVNNAMKGDNWSEKPRAS